MSRYYITTPIYYVNANPHLGHAYTTIVADCVNRFHRLLGQETFFLTGTDEHGDKIVQAAEDAGQSPQEYVDRISSKFQQQLPDLNISNDRFIRTTDSDHKDCVQRFLQQVYDNGDIYFGEYGGYYCFGCERFYTEKELVDGLCPDHLKPPKYIEEKNYFFRMQKYQDWLVQYIQDNPGFIQPERYRNEVLGMLREPLDDLCISRPKTRLTWGIELPFDDRYVTYVWFDALINYITALGWPDGDRYRQFWPVAHHLVAKDILKPHAIFWPTMLKAAGLEPYQGLHVHGYWTVNETKMSKSLGNVVAPLTMRDTYGLDGFRYFLLREMQFGLDASFSEEGLVARFNADLANDLGNLFNRALAMTHKYFGGRVPSPGALEDEDHAIRQLGVRAVQGYVDSGKSFAFAAGLRQLWDLVRGLNKYIDATAPWTLYKAGETERLGTVMYTVLEGMRQVALALWPVMPDASGSMLQQLGQPTDPSGRNMEEDVRQWDILAVGTEVAKKSNLFPRQEAVAKKEETPSEGQSGKNKPKKQASAQKEPETGVASFEDFQKVELLVGTILAAEPVAKADKLLQLQVDVGEEEPRQVVSGIAEHFAPEAVVGQQVVVVANLKPRKVFGILSQGMILAVHAEKGLQLVQPGGAVPAGSRVS
ncbi:methionine--tRNA ligase [Desulfohalobium retbaense]|uniref:Methionine--tRNA ligase n=1 Tax=Desulfohalobium retbaense (strain ATCC 49708 / DSM 5692 / JCM 16813 / HR100) TaxID=485915 RepID=C8WZZ2_DESRD|nr:methionine--tRNA ligase [Desulfohalobium retbaense]ACV67617.1 methionyl-tRNA synthetase [Desulfohalobium retbaense DSM 5692]